MVYTLHHTTMPTRLTQVTSYLMVRNGSSALQKYSSSVLSNVGSMSIWLFVSHYHILMGFDGRGILILIPKLYILNTTLVLLTFIVIFIITSNSLQILKEMKSLNYFVFVDNNKK